MDDNKDQQETCGMRPPSELPKDLSDVDIKAMVERLFIQEDDDFNLDRLKLAGSRAVPFLIDALQEPRTETATFPKVSPLALGSPFERICRLLDLQNGPPEAAFPLVKFLDNRANSSGNEQLSGWAILRRPTAWGPVSKALADKDDSVRSYAMIGVERAIKENRGERVFFDEIFPALEGVLNHLNYTTRNAPRILIRIEIGSGQSRNFCRLNYCPSTIQNSNKS